MLGNLPRGRADELRARVKIRKAAQPGQHVRLTAKATAKDAVSFSASGSFKIVSVHPPAPATPAATTPPATVPPLPPIPLAPEPTSSTASPGQLFPTVSPQPSDSPSPSGTAAGQRSPRGIRAASAANTLPLNSRLIGGQLAGLVVLAAAITLAIARLSLRPQRPHDGGTGAGE